MRTVRVLVLDDEPLVRESLGQYLSDEGFAVETASGIDEALISLRSRSPDVAIVDLRLGGSSGESFILRARALLPRLRVILHTASNGYQLPPTLRQIGLTSADVLHKPVSDLAEISRAIERAVADGTTHP